MQHDGRSVGRIVAPAWVLMALAASVVLAQQQMNLAGTWTSNIGLTYTITQKDSQFVWVDNAGGTGTITMAGQGLTAQWTDAGGPHTATGSVTQTDAAGAPARIGWSNGVTFLRVGAIGAPQLMQVAPLIQVTSAPAPPGQGGTGGGTQGTPSVPPPPTQPMDGAVESVCTEGCLLLLRVYPARTILPSGPAGYAAPLLRASFGTESTPGNDVAGVPGAMKTSPGEVLLVKAADKGSPAWIRAYADGTYLDAPSVEVYTVSGNQPPRLLFRWLMENVQVTGYQISLGTGAPTVTEQIRLRFDKVTITSYQLGTTGTGVSGGVLSTTWVLTKR